MLPVAASAFPTDARPRRGRALRPGWRPSLRPSPHPTYAIPPHHAAGHLPASVDLAPECPAVYDQGSLGSCTANALAALVQFLLMKESRPSFVPSRLMIYWGERSIEGTKDTDSGANGDDGITFLATKGVCREATWPYDPARFAQIPPPAAWAEAARHRIAGPMTIDGTDPVALKSCLASGRPIAFGFLAYPDLESDRVAATGDLPMPTAGESPIGGHAVLMVGYDDATARFKCRNSWGPAWGQAGYFTIPYAYATDPRLAGDYRSARSVS